MKNKTGTNLYFCFYKNNKHFTVKYKVKNPREMAIISFTQRANLVLHEDLYTQHIALIKSRFSFYSDSFKVHKDSLAIYANFYNDVVNKNYYKFKKDAKILAELLPELKVYLNEKTSNASTN